MNQKGEDKHRAEQYGVAYEWVERRRVYERDGWQCQLCQKPIDRTLKAPHRLSASLDHIIPISKGGPHTYANVQAAHLACNTVKGAGRLGVKMRLLGVA